MELLSRRRCAGGMSLGLVAALSTTLAVTGVVPAAAPAVADAGDGAATVRVVREVNANGKWDQALEPGLAGVQVVLTDDAGRTVTGTTMADGTVKLSPGTSLSGGRYRIEVKNPSPGVLSPGAASARTDLLDPTVLSSSVEFVDLSAGKNAEVTTSFWSPEDYCQQNATLVTSCQNSAMPAAPDSNRTLTSFPYNARGEFAQLTDLATVAQTGSLWGIGYNKVTRQIFAGAYAKRNTLYGPGGPGAIYRTDPATKATSLFTTVPNAGTTAHQPNVDVDEAFGAVVGKESLGDVEVSADGKDLYVVNLNDRRLYRYDATQPTAAAPKASYAIPNPGCASSSDWRPHGLGIQDGKVYVGGVCSAESTQNKADLRAVVQAFDPTTGNFTGVVMDQPLDYPRGSNAAGECTTNWRPWTSNLFASCGIVPGLGEITQRPQPILADITFETNGDMVLGFNDRWADVSGWELPPIGTHPATSAVAAGDINRACLGGNHKFVLDGNGGCTNNATPSNTGGFQAPEPKESYPGDWAWFGHLEISEGGVALSKVETTVAFTAMDPTDKTGSGVRWLDRTTGTRSGPGVFTGNPADYSDGNYLNESFGKSRGMADLEVLCDEAPLQIGNRVWQDADEDGVQDPGEKPLAGATVNLYDAQGNKIGTAVTNARGEYYFSSTQIAELKPGSPYTVKMDNPADYQAGGVLEGWSPTRPNQGGNDQVDSDGEPNGNPFPAVQITPTGTGANDHGADFGFRKPSVDLAVVKKGPWQAGPDPEQIKYDIVVTNNGPNDSSGWTVTDPLPSMLQNPSTTTPGCSIAAGTVTCVGGPLPVGQSRVITVFGTSPVVAERIVLDNCVKVVGKEPDPVMENNENCWPTEILPIPVIDPAVGGAAAALALGGVLIHRRRSTGSGTLA